MEVNQELTAAGPPLLATKLFAPRRRPDLVARPSLVARLNEGAARKLTVVAAPAGFGKTTLLAEWLATLAPGDRSVAWVSFDPDDNDPARFWSYVITALNVTLSGTGQKSLARLTSLPPPPITVVIAALINELSEVTDELTLVLDDYHVIDNQAIHDTLIFLIDHLPPCIHIVIASRADPPLPLARLRGRGEAIEIRAAELRFTPAEAAAFLNEAMDLNLTTVDIAALEGRTEGWIAGLQLAALSLRGRQNAAEFIRAFAGDHRYIADYLVDEVLRRQPAPVRDFLLQTAVLDRMTGPLCDAVTGQEHGDARLAALEGGNFFIVPLDDQRRWYRYHHLFADVLRAHLAAEQPDQVKPLHRRASVWYEQQGSAEAAIRHALLAEDFARAAAMVELELPELRRNRQVATLRGWLSELPGEMFHVRPVLNVAFAWVLLDGGQFQTVEPRLRDAEEWLELTAIPDPSPAAAALIEEMVVVDHEEYRRLPGSIAVYRAALAMILGDVDAAANQARTALALVSADDHLRRGAAGAILGLTSWVSGALDDAFREYSDGMASLARAGHHSDVITGAVTLADLSMERGRLNEAERALAQAMASATTRGAPGPGEMVDFSVRLSALRLEKNDIADAAHLLTRGAELANGPEFTYDRSRWCAAMARISAARGDFAGALVLLDEAERRYKADFFPNVRPVATMRARIWLAQGRLADAAGWARGLSYSDELSYLREFDHLTLARILLAQSVADRSDIPVRHALTLLERLGAAAEADGRRRSVIEILVLQALAHQRVGDLPAALARLTQALTLGEPEGFRRIFLDEGEPIQMLLRRVVAQSPASSYAESLLHVSDEPGRSSPTPALASDAILAEPLTAREIEILRLIAAGLRNQEIADRLFIGLATVKRHVANAYGKLGVNHRTEAIVRANQLKLL